jgi:hypothetical protein
MAVPYIFATIPNGQTIPLQYLDADFAYLESQITALGSGVLSVSGGTTGLLPAAPTGGNVVLSGVLNIANGGTGASTLTGLQANIFPSQAGNAGKFLTTDGAGSLSWAVGGGGGGGVVSFSGGTTGLLPNTPTTGAVSLAGTLAITNGGTGGTSAASAIANLLPSQTGNNGKVLSTDGFGILSWVNSPPAAAAGPDRSVQFNNATTTAGDAAFTYLGAGNVMANSYREKQTNGSIAAGVFTIDCNVGSVISTQLTSNINSVVFTNLPATTQSQSIILSFTGDGTARTITWPGNVRWPNSTPPVPTATAGKVDTYVVYTFDGGANWFAFISGQNA